MPCYGVAALIESWDPLQKVSVLPGDVITTKDAEDLVCGVFIVQTTGEYGLMTVYGDDPTLEGNQGFNEGETVNFLINQSAAETYLGASIPGVKREQDIITFNNGPTKQIALTYSGEVAWLISLHTPWNCVTVGVNPVNDDLGTVFSEAASAMVIVRKYAIDGVEVFDPDIPERFNTLKKAEGGCGYQILMEEEAECTIIGTSYIPSSTQLDLHVPWNVVPYYSHTEANISDFFGPIADKIVIVRGYLPDGVEVYDPDIPERFNTLKVVQPPYAYQVLMEEAGSFTP